MGKYDDAIGGVDINLSINEVLNEDSHKKVANKLEETRKKAEEPIKVKVDSGELNKLLKQEKEIVKTIKQLGHLKVNTKGISGLLNGNMSKAEIQKSIDALQSLYEIQNKIRQESGNTKRIGSDFLSGFSANDIKTDLLPKLQGQLSELNKLGLDNIAQLRERERLNSRLAKLSKKDFEHAKVRVVDGGDAEAEAKIIENIVANRRQVVEEMKASGLFYKQEIKELEKQNKAYLDQAEILREIRVAKVKAGEKIVVQKEDVIPVEQPAKKPRGRKSKAETPAIDTSSSKMSFTDGTPLDDKEVKMITKYLDIMKKKMGENYKEAEHLKAALDLVFDIKKRNIDKMMGRFTNGNDASNAVLNMATEMPVNNQKNRDAALRSLNTEEYDRIISERKSAMSKDKTDFQKKWEELASVMLGGDAFKNDSNLVKGKVAKAFEELGTTAKDGIEKINKMWLAGELEGKTFKNKYIQSYVNHLNDEKEHYDEMGKAQAGDMDMDGLFNGQADLKLTEEKAQALRAEAAAYDELIAKKKEYYGIKGTAEFKEDAETESLKEQKKELEIIENIKKRIISQRDRGDYDGQNDFDIRVSIEELLSDYGIHRDTNDDPNGQERLAKQIYSELFKSNEAGIDNKVSKVTEEQVGFNLDEEIKANKKLESSYEGLAEAVEEFVRNRNEKRKHKGDDKFWELDSKETELRQKLVGYIPEGTTAHSETYQKLEYKLNRKENRTGEITSAEDILKIVESGISKAKAEQNKLAKETADIEIKSGQMSMLPEVEEEVAAKNKLADANEKVAKSKKKVKEESQGEQVSFDNIIPKVAAETDAIEQSGKAAEKAAESKNKLADANKKVAAKGSATFDGDGEGGKNIWTTPRSGESLDTLNLPVRYEGENGQDAVQMFAGLKSQIEEMTGKPVTIDFSSNVNEDRQLEAVGATLKYVNEEAGVTVKQFYDIERSEDGILVATQSYEKATLSATKAAKNFNAEMQRKVAEAQIKTLETQMGELKLDLTDVKKAAADINDQASLDKFNLELKAAKEEAKQLKAELKGQNALDTIASMERSALALPSELERIKRKLEELGNVDGAEAISDVLKSVEEEYNKFLTTDKSEDKTKAFRSLSTSMTWIKAEMKNLTDLNSKQKKQETQVEKEELAEQRAAREAYIDWWKSTLNEQSKEEKEQGIADAALKKWEADVAKREQQEKAKDERVIEARKKKEAAYVAWWQKQFKLQEIEEQKKANKPYLNYGKTTANAAERKRDQLQGRYDNFKDTFEISPEVEVQMDAYKKKIQEVVNLRNQFANDPNAAKDPVLVAQFQKISYEAEQARKSIQAILDEEDKMYQMSAEQGFEQIHLLPEQIADSKNEMLKLAKRHADGRVDIKGFNADYTKLYYTVTNAKGTVQEMTIALGQGTNTMYQYRTATKETGTAFERFMNGIRTKAKEISTFILGGGSIYKLISIGREGIRVVRDIDIALTELKKVTDETEETYDKFLDTASKTAAKVGSTIKDIISSTADWARLNI